VAFTVGADEDVTVRGDRDLLFEAIANLVDNAVKFTPEGGRVELSLSREGDEGIVRVRDGTWDCCKRTRTRRAPILPVR
jgi:signal transduction histidine kinase